MVTRCKKVLEGFINCYRGTCELEGFRLAVLEDEVKAFDEATTGVVLGVFYNLEERTWWLGKNRSARMILDLKVGPITPSRAG